MKQSKLTVIFASALLCFGFAVSPITAFAEDVEESVEISVETSEIIASEEVVEETESVENSANDEVVEEDNGIIPETEGSEWFDKYILPFLVEYGGDIVALATMGWFFLKKLKKAKEAFESATGLLGVANKKVEGTDAEVKRLREENDAMRKALQEDMEKFKTELVETLKEVLTDKVEDIDETVHKILDVEEIAYESNAKLVGNGTAKKISEVIRK
jgi:hypothetical protein